MATQDLRAFGVDVADPGRGTPEEQLSIEHNSSSTFVIGGCARAAGPDS